MNDIPYGDIGDEKVKLSGGQLRSIVKHFVQNGFGLYRFAPFKRGIVQGIMEESTWCQACNLFLLHEGTAASLPPPQQWAMCNNGTLRHFSLGWHPTRASGSMQ